MSLKHSAGWQSLARAYYINKVSKVLGFPFPSYFLQEDAVLMRKMKADGMRIGVVTGSGQRPLIQRLCRDFEGLIELPYIVTSYDVTRGKPEPDPYLKGLEKVGVAATEAIVVENAPLGVRAAVAANIFTVAVNTGPLPEEMLKDEKANVVFKKMTDFCEAWDNFSTNNELI